MCKVDINDLKGEFLPKKIGQYVNEKINIQDGFILLKIDYKFNQPIQIESNQNDKKFVITISLKGNSLYTNISDKKTLYFKEGYTTISLFEKTKGYR